VTLGTFAVAQDRRAQHERRRDCLASCASAFRLDAIDKRAPAHGRVTSKNCGYDSRICIGRMWRFIARLRLPKRAVPLTIHTEVADADRAFAIDAGAEVLP
jgi:hypothetical protein